MTDLIHQLETAAERDKAREAFARLGFAAPVVAALKAREVERKDG